MNMTATIPLETVLHALSGLSLDNRRWLAEHLLLPAERQATSSIENVSDDDFIRDFLATPYDNPMTAEEHKKMIRDSHQFGMRLSTMQR